MSPLQPFHHQTQAFERFKDKSYGALFLEQGLGKSKIAIDIACYHAQREEITAVLVICPKSLIDNWALIEIPKHSTHVGDIIKWRQGKHRPYPFVKKFTWFIVNIDAIITESFVAAFREFYNTYPHFMIIIDESTSIKSPKSQRTERAWQVSHYAKYRFILTGAPITNSPLDIWAQAQALSPHLPVVGQTFFMFKQHFAIIERVTMGFKTFNKIKGYRNLDELTSLVQKFSIIARKKDCLDLPDKIFRQVPIELTKEQRELYMDFKQQAVMTIKHIEITAVNAISMINGLLQICAGQIKMPDGTYNYIPTDRIELLNELIDESDEKAIVWCSFVGAANSIHEALKEKMLRIKADTNADTRQGILTRFSLDGPDDKKAILLNQASTGKGLTILEGRNVVYYSQRFSVEQRIQSEDRSHRIGQTKNILISELYAPGTVEEKVLKVLQDGRQMGESVIVSNLLKDKGTLLEFIG